MSALSSPCLPETSQLPSLASRSPLPRIVVRDDSRLEDRAIRRGFSWLAVGNFVNAACSWGRLALLARLGTADMVGQLTLALAVCKPIADFADIGLSGALVSDAKREFRLGDYLGLRLMTCMLAALVIAGMAWTGGYDAATARLVGLAGVLVVFRGNRCAMHFSRPCCSVTNGCTGWPFRWSCAESPGWRFSRASSGQLTIWLGPCLDSAFLRSPRSWPSMCRGRWHVRVGWRQACRRPTQGKRMASPRWQLGSTDTLLSPRLAQPAARQHRARPSLQIRVTTSKISPLYRITRGWSKCGAGAGSRSPAA